MLMELLHLDFFRLLFRRKGGMLFHTSRKVEPDLVLLFCLFARRLRLSCFSGAG